MANQITRTISECRDCIYSHVEKIYTPDSFEHESGIYCSKCKDPDPYPGAQTKDRLIKDSDKDPRDNSFIPDWCPLIDRPKIPNYPITRKVPYFSILSDEEKSLLVKAVSIEGNVWVQGFFVKRQTGNFDSFHQWREYFVSNVITQISDAGFTSVEVYPESVCRCTMIPCTGGDFIFEHDFLDENHYNEVEYIRDGFYVNGDSPLSCYVREKVKVYGNRFDKIIWENQKKGLIDK